MSKYKPGQSGNPKGRPPGKSKFSTLKDAFLEAFEDLDSAEGLVTWIKSDPENQKVFYQLVSKMLPREVSASVSIDINKYAFLPGRKIPREVLRDYLVELVLVQQIHTEVRKKIIGMIRGDFTPIQISLTGLKASYEQATREMGRICPAEQGKRTDLSKNRTEDFPEKNSKSLRIKVRPVQKALPEQKQKLSEKEKRLKELERELAEAD